MQPKVDFRGALGAKNLGKRRRFIPLLAGHEALESRGLDGGLRLELGVNALQLDKGLVGIAQLQPTEGGHEVMRGWGFQRIHCGLFTFA